MFLKNSPGLFFLLLLVSCTVDDNIPIGAQLLENPHISLAADSVFPWTPEKSGDIELGVSKDIFMTGYQSLYIENSDNSGIGSGSWTQTYRGPMPAQGTSLELTAFVKGENISNLSLDGNISIFFQVFPGSNSKEYTESRFISSGNSLVLKGDFEWTVIKSRLENFPSEADFIKVSLFYPTLTVGKVYFDEITLTVK